MIRSAKMDCIPYLHVIIVILLGSCHGVKSSSSCEIDPTTGECVGDEKVDTSERCGLFMAPSTIPGAGLGIFTGIDRFEDETIGQGDVMIPLSDHWYHLDALGDVAIARPDWVYMDPTANFVWSGPELGMMESAHPFADVEYLLGYAPGIDAAINCNLALINVDKTYPEYDFCGLHRSLDHGVGGFTPYHGCETVVRHDVPAGGELFKNYGDHWFTFRVDVFGDIPLSYSYPQAETLIKKLHGLLEANKVSEEIRIDLWHLISNIGNGQSRTLNAFPRPYETLKLIAEEGIRAAYQPNATRSLDYLDAKGRCMDNVRPDHSTIRQAGRGAFATRAISKNQTVTGTPMLFFPTGDFFNMYEGEWKTKQSRDSNTIKRLQILYNYCWHHKESSIFLCPYGSGVNYVNHNKTRANVRFQWALDGQMNHDATLLAKSPSAMYHIAAPKLHLDMIAVRDIEPGEELFMDYGDAWERAWLEHVQNWETKEGSHDKNYVSAREWNKLNPASVLRTGEEQESEPYPANFRLVCLEDISFDSEITISLTSDVVLEKKKPNSFGIPCVITEREVQDDGSYWYKVQYLDLGGENPPLDFNPNESDEWYDSDWIVREAMWFTDSPYTDDLFLDDAFRQYIGFPDDLFPDAWRGEILDPLPNWKVS